MQDADAQHNEGRASILNAGGANPNVLPNEDQIPRMIQQMQDLAVGRGSARGEAPAAPQDPKIYFSACWRHFEQANRDPFAAVRDAERNFRRENNGNPDNGVLRVPNENLNAAGVVPVSPSRTIGEENKDRLNQLKLEAYNSDPIYKELLDENKFMFKYTATSRSSVSDKVNKAKEKFEKLYRESDTNCVLIFVSSHKQLPTSMNPEFDVTIEDGRPAIWIGKFLDKIDDQIKIVYLQKIGKLALELRYLRLTALEWATDRSHNINEDVVPALEYFVTRLAYVMNN